MRISGTLILRYCLKNLIWVLFYFNLLVDPRAPPEDIEVIPLNRTAVNITWHVSCAYGLEPLVSVV